MRQGFDAYLLTWDVYLWHHVHLLSNAVSPWLLFLVFLEEEIQVDFSEDLILSVCSKNL